MNILKVKNVILGKDMPKICVPIVGITMDEILSEANAVKQTSADMVEWRADWYEDVFHEQKVLEVLYQLRKILQETPILFTFRTSNEGGEKGISSSNYKTLNISVSNSGLVDLIDVEGFMGDTLVSSIVSFAHKHNVKVIVSNHNFEKTPAKEEIIHRLCKMQELGADIPKIAVMPNCQKDVLTLLEATIEMNEKYAKGPIITMSMSNLGSISRISGQYFGSALTFGALKKSSAPGQLEVEDLAQMLKIIHANI